MKIEEIKETPIWKLYEKGRNYHWRTGIYTDSKRNYRFYNGDQWEGAKLGDVEPVQKNFIMPIVKYKCSVIHDNLYAIVYSSQNYENPEFRKSAERYCDLLNGYAARIWERDKMDFKLRRITKDAAINDEGIFYVDFDREKMTPINEIIDKVDIYYGDENNDDLQSQPYILIRKRLPQSTAIDFALSHGMSEDKKDLIVCDNETFEQSGEAAQIEVDDKVTLIYKFYKKDGTIHFSIATRLVTIAEDEDMGISLYPFAHFVWEEKKGSARGEGEVRRLIPNQIEVNRTEVRRVLTVKYQAFPQKVVAKEKVENPSALNTVGGIIVTKGSTVDDVHKVVGTIQPAQMSPDVVQLQEGLIQMSRDLAGAGDTATGAVDPEAASGRAILAVQQAQRAPMTEQKETCKNTIEDLARIWLEYLIIHSENGVNMEEKVTDLQSGEETVQIVNVPQSALQQLQATVKIDVTPKSVYDRLAQEQTIENLLLQGLFNVQRLSELEIYYKILPDDSVAPKVMIGEAIDYMKEEQRKIAMIQAQAQAMQQMAQQFLMEDPDGQAQQIAESTERMQMEKALAEEEAKYAKQEAELDEETAEEEAQTEE